MANYFSHARSINTLYCSKEGDALEDVRFCLARHGEDATLVIEQFWAEQPAHGFVVAPIFAHGLPPRRALSTRASIEAALASVSLEPGSALEMQWKEVADGLGVPWPTLEEAAYDKERSTASRVRPHPGCTQHQTLTATGAGPRLAWS